MKRAAPTLTIPEPPHTRFNFAVLVGDIACFFIGMAFLDASTALPAIVQMLGGDEAYVGVLLALKQGAYFLPPLFVAHRLQNRSRYKPFLLRVCFWGRVWFWPAALAVWFFGVRLPLVALIALTIAYTISWLGDGAGGVPWTAIVGRAIPARRRGRLFALSQVVNGVARLGVAAVVFALLSGRFVGFPNNAALLIGGCAVFVSISWVFLALIREPPLSAIEAAASEQANSPGLGEYLRRMPALLKARPDFGRLALAQVLGTAAGASAPFILFYAEALHVSTKSLPQSVANVLGNLPTGGLAGLFLLVQTVGYVFCAPLWGQTTDQKGPRRTLIAILSLSLLSPIAALAGGFTSGNLLFFLLAYLVYGAIQDGWVAITNYLLEAVPETEQAAYIALMNAASIPALLLPIVAGLLAKLFSPAAAFLLALLLLLVALWAAISLPDTRRPPQTA